MGRGEVWQGSRISRPGAKGRSKGAKGGEKVRLGKFWTRPPKPRGMGGWDKDRILKISRHVTQTLRRA